MRELEVKFPEQATSCISCLHTLVKPKEKRYAKVETHLLDQISRLGIFKMLGLNIHDTLTMIVEFKGSKAFLEVTDDSIKVIVLDPKGTVVILDIRSLESYKIQQGVLQWVE